MGLLDSISSPRGLRGLDDQQLSDLAAEIRAFLVAKVSRTGGHLGPNLGVVELTMAVHRVFDSPHDRIVFDTGHQAYVHKILTGRADRFDSLRQQGGLSGYPSQAESEHDVVENSHASTALSYADGLAKAYVVRGEDRYVVAVVGDGALTGGMSWEALNNIAAAADSRLVIVVNDNGRSYSPTVGGVAHHLTSLRTDPRYEQILDLIRTKLTRTKLVGPPLYDTLHAVKRGLKDALAPQGMFEDLGLKYVGPVDGHDRPALEQALSQARSFGGPVIVHAVTKKGNGYPPAERHEADNLHSPSGAFDPETGELLASAAQIWTDVFRDEMVAIGADRPDVVAITAAMLHRRLLSRAHLRRRNRRAARGHLSCRYGHGWPAPGRRCLRDVPQPGVRPGVDGRCAAPLRHHDHARPRRRHRRRRAFAQRHVGPVDPAGRAGSADRGSTRR
jgi:1-deoxy-D-xylulose-5-phosphate synthase